MQAMQANPSRFSRLHFGHDCIQTDHQNISAGAAAPSADAARNFFNYWNQQGRFSKSLAWAFIVQSSSNQIIDWNIKSFFFGAKVAPWVIIQ